MKKLLLIMLLILGTTLTLNAAYAQDSSQCSPIDNNLRANGEFTLPFYIADEGIYNLYARIMANGSNANSIYVTVDDTCPVILGNDNNMENNKWIYINFRNGDTSDLASYYLTNKTHKIVVTASEPDVKVDKILFVKSTSDCVPVGKDDVCGGNVSVNTETNNDQGSHQIKIYAAAKDYYGRYPNMKLYIDGENVKSWDKITNWRDDRPYPAYTYNSNEPILGKEVRIYFTNDEYEIPYIEDKNLYIDKIEIDGKIFETESSEVFSTSCNGKGYYPEREALWCNGYVRYPTKDYSDNSNTTGPTSTTNPSPTQKPTTLPSKTPTPTVKLSNTSRPYFGYAVDTSQISNYSNHIKKYGVQVIAPANSMKMDTIGGCNGNYNYSKADSILNFAKNNNLVMHGHTLVWYSQTSNCASNFSKSDLKNYIQNVMKHYCGKLYSMDVVNEALADSGGYRTNSVWYRLYGGTGYIEDSFRWAREACPSMKLYYNDYSIETYGQAKTTSMINLVKSLKSKNLIDGVGFQAHWTRTFNKDLWAKTMDEVSKLGLEFAISEMDVRFEKNYWDISQSELNTQATTYKNAAELCKNKSACHHFIVWGVHDGDSWVNSWLGISDSPLLFTRQLKPKPAYCNGVKPVFNLPNGDC